MTEQIVILDFGSQYTQVIARRIRECNVYSIILRYDTPASEIAALQPKGIILSGGPSSVYAKDAPLPDPAIFKLGVPMLGICYGLQLLAHYLGGKVEPGQKREYGKGTLRVKDSFCPLFANLPEKLQVWNSHGDKLTKLPTGFKSVAVTENSDYAAIENRAGKVFGLQFHPEVVHTPHGREIIANFVHNICGCGKNWTMRNYIDQAVEEIRAQVGGEGDPGAERRRGFQRGGGADSQGHWRPADLHLRQQRRAARARGGGGAGGLRPTLQDQAAIRECLEAVPGAAQGRDRSGAQTQDHRPDLHRGVSRRPPGGPARRSSSRRARFTRT